MSIVHRLRGAAYGAHLADQISLVAVPLVAALAFNAPPAMIGALVACQSMAHLLGSIPSGILVDRQQLRSLAIVATLVSAAGFACAALSIAIGSVTGFGAAITLAGFGVVLFTLTALSILPKAVPATGLARANSAIEIPRAVCSFAVPLGIGLIVTQVPAALIFALAACGALVAFGFALSLPRFDIAPRVRVALLPQIVEGGRFVLQHRLLLPISLCAIFWNLAFSALLVALVPAIRTLFRMDPGVFGIGLSAFGLAAVLGSWVAGRFADRIAPAVILIFGPGSSMLAALGIASLGAQSSAALLYACFFLLGFGPAMWLIAQNSVRQLVTPPAMLGRVNAVIQTAIYGVRPLGALIGGGVVGAAGPQAGLMLVTLAFALSLAVALFSGLRAVISYADLRPAGTA